METLAEFSAAGVAVFSVAADAGDPKAWRGVLKWAHERLPAVQHFAHAAGVTGFDMLQVIACKSSCAGCLWRLK